MKIKWLGHASFLITSENGTRIITDPYAVGGKLLYSEIKEAADIVTVSHEHYDHNNVKTVQGNPQIYRGPTATEIKDVKLFGLPTFHDDTSGSQRGPNMIVCMEIDGLKVCHLGDLGVRLTEQEATKIGTVDILLTPVGGFYTIDAEAATAVANLLKPKVIIPMHFKNQGCSFPIAPVENFSQDKKNVHQADISEIEFKAGKIPTETRVIILRPALCSC